MVDQDALADALRSLGMLYGSKADVVRGASDVHEAIRSYIVRERPHLLRSYDIEALVDLVLGVMERRSDAQPAFEQFGPAG
jgi:hypothetical protein